MSNSIEVAGVLEAELKGFSAMLCEENNLQGADVLKVISKRHLAVVEVTISFRCAPRDKVVLPLTSEELAKYDNLYRPIPIGSVVYKLDNDGLYYPFRIIAFTRRGSRNYAGEYVDYPEFGRVRTFKPRFKGRDELSLNEIGK